MIRDLTDKERDFLVDYCTKPENTWLALAIGQIQPVLRKAITSNTSNFLEELDKSIKKNLEECGLHWETCVPETNLEAAQNSIYVMKMNIQDQDIQIELGYEKENLYVNLYVGIPSNEVFSPDELRDFFKKERLKDSEQNNNQKYPWWIYPEESHKSLETLIMLHDAQLKREKIEYFTDELVLPAKAISKALKA